MHHQRFVLKLPVDVQLLALDFNGVPCQRNTSFDEIATGILRVLEDNDIAALRRSVGKDPMENGVRIAREHKLVDDQVVADEKIVLHRSRRDLEILKNKCAHEKRQNESHQYGLIVLTCDRFPHRIPPFVVDSTRLLLATHGAYPVVATLPAPVRPTAVGHRRGLRGEQAALRARS